jgi:hypothetical protein
MGHAQRRRTERQPLSRRCSMIVAGVGCAWFVFVTFGGCTPESKKASTATSAAGGASSGTGTIAPTPTTTLDPLTAERIAEQDATEPGFFQITLPAKSISAAKKYQVDATVFPQNAPTGPAVSGVTLPALPTQISTTMAVVLEATDATVTSDIGNTIDAAKQTLLLIGNEHTTWQWTIVPNEPTLPQTSYTLHLIFHEYFFVHPDDAQGVEETPAPARDLSVTINSQDVVKHGISNLWKFIIALSGVVVALVALLGLRRKRHKTRGSLPVGDSAQGSVNEPPSTRPAGQPSATNGRRHRRRPPLKSPNP